MISNRVALVALLMQTKRGLVTVLVQIGNFQSTYSRETNTAVNESPKNRAIANIKQRVSAWQCNDWRARVAERARVSRLALLADRAMNRACAGFGTGIGDRILVAAPMIYL